MAYIAGITVGTSAAVAAQIATASALCLPTPLIKVNPDTFMELVADLFMIVHGRDRSYHVYLGRYQDQFVIYTRSPNPLNVPVEIEALKISKTINL